MGNNPYRAVDPYGLYQKDFNYAYKDGKRVVESHTWNNGRNQANYHLGYILTDKKTKIRALKWIDGDPKMNKNCVVYALGVNLWIDPEDAMPLIKEEFVKTSFFNASYTLYGVTDNSFKHIGVNKVFPFVSGKNGAENIKHQYYFNLENGYLNYEYYKKK